MITKTKQNWSPGQQVRVGFLTLTVQAALATPGDGMPDVYFLTNQAGEKLFRFTPHFGLERISIEEAERQMADARRSCERIAAAAISKAAKQSAAHSAINRAFGPRTQEEIAELVDRSRTGDRHATALLDTLTTIPPLGMGPLAPEVL